ncbi:hypothetical protein PHYSODRAFT_335455 [Phytophthora sojae]|uniref:Uncharacterized protein n=1 Tax=Phytophthora sojae (strain P6497) TaxID=1094619 RepID=G4ZV88_PHYSP|nr:hypothetical protein PHYSODRAFT_335455 [Phytophthora sojae]EGZ13712.1 hypothetical protein PHYSODRAFT_335455 [Phytophthora sojae]|eukprot:XP_009531141.1 hypothetical protein PHYSODRAFT_335455 [Phytophthora sojae]
MSISSGGALAQGILVSFNSLLCTYCLTVAIVIIWQPCSASRLSTDPAEHSATRACRTSELELFMLAFHLAFAALSLAGAIVAYIGHIVLVRITRAMLVVFAAIYTALAIYQAVADHLTSLLGPLELVVSVVTFAVGVPSGVLYERELRSHRQVLPDAFNGVLPSSSSSTTSSHRTIDRQPSAVTPAAVRLAW